MDSHRNGSYRSTAWLLITVFGLFAASASDLQGEEARTLTRDDAIRLAFQNNRALAVANLEIKRAGSRLRWSGRLENPELEFSYSGDGVGLDEDESMLEVGLSQKFPLTAKLKHEKNLRRHQVLLAEAEIAEQRRELAGEIDLAIVELLATSEEIRLSSKLVDLNRKIVDFLKEQVKRGEVSSLDVTQAILNGRTLEQTKKSLSATEKQQRLALNQLIGLDPTTPVDLQGQVALPGARPSFDVSLRTVLCHRPDYVLALAKIDESEAAITLEESKRWEDVAVRIFVEDENSVDEPIGLEKNTFAGFGISIPLPIRNRNQEGIEQAQIDCEAAAKELESARFRIRAECEEAFHERADAWEIAKEASGEILQLAEKNLDEFQTAYQQGQASLIQVQRAQEQLLELRTSSIQFNTSYHRAAARVRLATGSYPGLGVSSNESK